VPHKIADAGLIAGIILIIFGIAMPNITFTMPVILLFVVGCLCLGGAAHLALKGNAPPAITTPEKADNTMGTVTNNSGIVTQDQRGDNAMGPK
jgi:hypothetical protein